jgi:alanine dehydrogenase
MRVGVPTEIKTDEHRVAITPAGVRELVDHGNEVIVQQGAGLGSAISDDDYLAQGARIVAGAEAVFAEAEMIVKVKEPQPVEVPLLRADDVLFTYLHLAPDPALTQGLAELGATCVAYETVMDRNGRLPLLAPMSEVAGKIATQAGAFILEKPLGGRGLLLGGVPWRSGRQGRRNRRRRRRPRGRRDRHRHGRRDLRPRPQHRPATRTGLPPRLLHHLLHNPCHRGTVAAGRSGHRRGPRPRRQGAAPTAPLTYEIDGVTHYCVANMPGAVPITSTAALTNATIPYVVKLATEGVHRALDSDPGFMAGLNVVAGKVTYEPVARDQAVEYTPPADALRIPAAEAAGV